MKIIDAEALKKALSDKNLITWTHEYGDAIPVGWVMSVIDNAPELGYEDGVLLVENTTRRAIELEEAYNNGWSDGFNEGESERPKGEWITIKVDIDLDDTICSSCGKSCEDIEGTPHKTNYCPHCGADMRGAE